MVWLAGKLDPIRVTTWPTLPDVGLMLAVGVGMVKLMVGAVLGTASWTITL